MRSRLLCAAVAAHALVCHAALERHSESPRALAMAGATCALPGDHWGAVSNPAGLSSVGTRTVALSWAPRPYGMKDLERCALVLLEPLPSAAVALTGVTYGFALYRELSLGLACGLRLTPSWRVGVALTCYRLTIQGYGSDVAFGMDAGMTWDLTRDLHLGCAATNVNGPVLGTHREKLPQSLTFGLAYAPAEGVLLSVDIVKDVRFPAEMRAGIEYTVLKALSLRMGTTRQPSAWTAGCGVHVSTIDFDYAFSRHDQLGWVHRLGLSLFIGEW